MPDLLLQVTPQEFADWTVQQVRRGFGLVPLVGSGLSAPSGILTGQDFTNFLAWTVYRCVAGIKDGKPPRHDLRRDGWPDPPTQKDLVEVREWVWKQFIAVCYDCGGRINGKDLGEAQELFPELGKLSLEAEDKADLIRWNVLRPLVPEVLQVPNARASNDFSRDLLHSLGRERTIQRMPPRRGRFASSTLYVEEAAVRSLHEWRAALVFLARLRVDNTNRNIPLALDEQPDQVVVDAFNFRITRGRRPNLAHNMLCHLAGRARIQILLTTNFDTLIEDAFAQLGQPLIPISVSVRGELPAVETVLSQASVVKMHGSLLETRADFSLDDPPTPADLDRFFTYVRGYAPRERPHSGHIPSLLFVCGYSGSDLRCVQMIQHLLETDSNAKVLWVSHTTSGADALKKIFHAYKPENSRDLKSSLPWPNARVITTVTNRCDLLLYEIYQRLTLCLPRGGFNYQFSANVPPALDGAGSGPSPFPKVPTDAKAVASFRADPQFQEWSEDQRSIAIELWQKLQPGLTGSNPHDPQRKILAVDGASGLLEPVRAVFRHVSERERSKGSVWLYLGDHANTTSLAHELFTVMALRLGRFQLDHARFDPVRDGDVGSKDIETAYERWKTVVNELLSHWDENPDNWFVVVDGRAGPGGSAGWTRETWEPEEHLELIGFLRALADSRNLRASSKGFHVLYAPFSKERSERVDTHGKNLDEASTVLRKLVNDGYQAKSKVIPTLVNSPTKRHPKRGKWKDGIGEWMGPAVESKCNAWLDFILPKEEPAPTYDTKLKTVQDYWINDNHRGFAGRRSLYAAALLRHSRHFSLFLSEGILPCPHRYNAAQRDNDWTRHILIEDWLKTWTEEGFFQAKTGGFYWMYRDLRLGIQTVVEEGVQPLEMKSVPSEERWLGAPWEGRSRTHFWIADWYARAYRATGHAEPLMEALHHYAQCVSFAPCARISVPQGGYRAGKEPDLPGYRSRYARRAVFEIIKSLRLGRREIRFWMQSGTGETWFGETAIKALLGVFNEAFTKMGATFDDAWEEQLRSEAAQLPRKDESNETVLAPPQILTAGDRRNFRLQRMVEVEPLCDPGKWWQHMVTTLDGRGHLAKIVQTFRGKRDVPLETYGIELNQELKRRAAKIAGWAGKQPEARHFFVEALIELAYATVKCAKRAKNCGIKSGSPEPERKKWEKDIQRLWIGVCALCWLALDACYDLPPSFLAADCRLRIAASTLYGLALGRLGRFFEAHRRFNEAHGWLSKSAVQLDPLEMAIIEIRRAEVHLLEAVRLRAIIEKWKPDFGEWKQLCSEVSEDTANQWQEIYLGDRPEKPALDTSEGILEELLRIHVAKLDDAWLALEPAESALSGKTHSSLWWGRLHILRLRVYGEHWRPDKMAAPPPRHPHRARVFGNRLDHVEAVKKLYRAGHAVARLDAYRELQLVDYVLKALKNATDFGPRHGGNDFRKAGGNADKLFTDELEVVLEKDFSDFAAKWSVDPKSEAALKLLAPYYESVANDLRK